MSVATDRHTSARQQRGITLIEALIALFIMSIGLLGVAGLQATSIAAGHSSGQRSLAVFHSTALGEMMRANRSAGLLYSTATTTPTDANGCSDTATAANLCTAAQMAAEDLFHWQTALNQAFAATGNSALNFGTVTVTANAGTTPASFTAIVNIAWTERGNAMNYTTSVVF